MPYVRIEITDGATYEQKLQIYKETTEMLVRILNKKPEYTFVVIEEVDNKNWGHMGTSVAKIREAEAKAKAKAAVKAPKVTKAKDKPKPAKPKPRTVKA
jgi:4-oxalocrotonate tautomerase